MNLAMSVETMIFNFMEMLLSLMVD